MIKLNGFEYNLLLVINYVFANWLFQAQTTHYILIRNIYFNMSDLY